MTIEECYTKLESDYREIVRRLGKEERVKNFLSLFPEDESYPALCVALEEGRGEEAFRAAHSLKGICMNLGIERLYRMADVLTEELRDRKITKKAETLFEQVRKEYVRTVAYIRNLTI